MNPKCKKCGKTAYIAEKITMQGQDWHIECLRCSEETCNKKLNGSNWGGFVDPEGDNKPYCSIHLARLAQSGLLPQQKSKWEEKQAAGGGTTTTTSSTPSRWGGGTQDKCTGCNKTVYVAEKLVMQGQIWHGDCLKCVQCNMKLNGGNWGGFVPPDNKAYCNRHYLQLVQAAGGATAFSGSAGTTWTPKTTGTTSSTPIPKDDQCTGCGKRCYQAEKIKMEGQTWHPNCLRCVECNKQISGSNYGGFVPPDNKPYCKNHYERLVQLAGSSVALSGSVGVWNSKAPPSTNM